MAENVFHKVTRLANGAITAKRFGKVDSTNQIAQLTTAGDAADGVISFSATSGQPATLEYDGDRLEVSASGAISAGADISSDANGQAKTAAAGEKVLGKALTAAAALNDIIEMKFYRNVVGRGAAQADTSGATLVALETEVNSLKAKLRAAGIVG